MAASWSGKFGSFATGRDAVDCGLQLGGERGTPIRSRQVRSRGRTVVRDQQESGAEKVEPATSDPTAGREPGKAVEDRGPALGILAAADHSGRLVQHQYSQRFTTPLRRRLAVDEDTVVRCDTLADVGRFAVLRDDQGAHFSVIAMAPPAETA